MLSDFKKEKIAISVIRTLTSRFGSFPLDSSSNRNAPFHEAFLNAFSDKLNGKVQDIPFFISLSSWLHGLNTTMGQTFFESIAHTLSDGDKKDFTPTRGSLLQVKPAQKAAIGDIITDLKNKVHTPDLVRESALIYITNTEAFVDANSFTVDVYVETTTEILAFEIKSVKPNAGEMRGEKQKIIEAKAALYNAFPGKTINFYLGFPFDPTSPTHTGYDKSRFIEYPIDLKKYFALDEFLIGEELWDKLSGDTNTMSQLLDIINAIATPEFIEKVNYLNDRTKRSEADYKILLQLWNLHSEIELIDNEHTILSKLPGNRIAQKRYNQDILNSKGEYNFARYTVLKALI